MKKIVPCRWASSLAVLLLLMIRVTGDAQTQPLPQSRVCLDVNLVVLHATRNPGVLRRLAQATGGEALFPGQLSDVVSICERIAREIRDQYMIGYLSGSEAQPGAYRSVRVVATAAGGG